MLVHPDFKPTRWQLFLVKLFIFVGLCLPYLTPPLYWMLSASYGQLFKSAHPQAFRAISGILMLLDLCLLPANIYWDCSLGRRFINKIKQLSSILRSGSSPTDAATTTSDGAGTTTAATASTLSHTEVLLSLSRNTLAYILISFLCNFTFFLAWCKVIPGIALVRLGRRMGQATQLHPATSQPDTSGFIIHMDRCPCSSTFHSPSPPIISSGPKRAPSPSPSSATPSATTHVRVSALLSARMNNRPTSLSPFFFWGSLTYPAH